MASITPGKDLFLSIGGRTNIACLFDYRKSDLKNTQSTQKEVVDEDLVQKASTVHENDTDGSWCQPIYFNYKCYSASFLSRARLAGLPKKVGPGPVQLVMREVLNLIIGSSFKSGSVLKRLEAKNSQPASADFVIEELKGKSRVLNLKGLIEIPTKVHQVDKYLRETCQKLSACPNLVSTVIYEDVCPVDCHNRPKADFKVIIRIILLLTACLRFPMYTENVLKKYP